MAHGTSMSYVLWHNAGLSQHMRRFAWISPLVYWETLAWLRWLRDELRSLQGAARILMPIGIVRLFVDLPEAWAQQPILMFQWDAQVAPVQYANAFGRRWWPAAPAWRRVLLFAIKDLQLVGRPLPTGLVRECGMVLSPVMFWLGLRAVFLPTSVGVAGRIAEGLAAGLVVVAVLAARRGLGSRGLESHQWHRLAPVLGFRELVSIKMRIAAGYTAALGLVLPAALLLWPSVLQPDLPVPGTVVLMAIPLGGLAGAVLGVTGTSIGMLVPGAPTGLLMPGASRTGLLLYGLCCTPAIAVWVGAVTVWAMGLVSAAGLMGACVGAVVYLVAASAGALVWAAYRFRQGPK
jgi:hypothetical protein